MDQLEAGVRGIEHDGLVWGASKLVPVGFGIKKLQINLVVEDEKISLSDLEEQVSFEIPSPTSLVGGYPTNYNFFRNPPQMRPS